MLSPIGAHGGARNSACEPGPSASIFRTQKYDTLAVGLLKARPALISTPETASSGRRSSAVRKAFRRPTASGFRRATARRSVCAPSPRREKPDRPSACRKRTTNRPGAGAELDSAAADIEARTVTRQSSPGTREIRLGRVDAGDIGRGAVRQNAVRHRAGTAADIQPARAARQAEPGENVLAAPPAPAAHEFFTNVGMHENGREIAFAHGHPSFSSARDRALSGASGATPRFESRSSSWRHTANP